MTFSSYPEYKSSGHEWVDKVPSHWHIFRSKNIFSERNVKAIESDEQLTASQKYGVIPQRLFSELEDQKVVQVILGRDILKKAEVNDFVISMRSFQGGLEFCSYSGAVSSAYVPLFANREIDNRFFKHLFKSAPFISALQNTSNLVRDGQALRYNNFVQLSLPFPSLSEQRTIGAFLDYEIAHINSLIKEQQHLIELIKEKRRGIALSALSDQNLPLVRLDHAVDVVSRPVKQREGETYSAIGVFNRDRGLFHKESKEMHDMGDSDFFWIKSGDLIISGQFAWEGAVALAGNDEEGMVVSHRYPVLRGKQGIAETEFVYALLTTKHGDFLLNESSRGAAGRNRPLNLSALLKEKIRIPSKEIQQQVCALVRYEAEVLAECRQQIGLLQERRSALISAAVTGKIDVRGWQPPASA
ncbi:restriction endonuclease subunit S [Pseudomonas sp. 5P_3.1_Bac2]|uniref:restriction endonuclease subunit S n=1 Tax=Pseudomonas sp. 5P_3.1_Bac2 TaxID=2971617 RepID=UPI0021C7067F|nr:restriction endonuclease subunit S [Pseudomonas sp. 5P_3.1_Bac2]MCU1718860.1 restriction endonuclease subunit S [Pseudomonas sp. 5P_3.1_Bac2]